MDFKQAKKVIQWFQVQNWASRTGLNISDSTFFLSKYYIYRFEGWNLLSYFYATAVSWYDIKVKEIYSEKA